MKRLVFALFTLASSHCMPPEVLLKEEAGTVNRNTAWLVHATPVFPRNGVLVAGVLGEMENLAPDFSTQEALYKQLENFELSFIRNSIHWSVNSLVYSHEADVRNLDNVMHKIIVKKEARPYCILEPMRALQDAHLCGLWQDVFNLGSHTLSAQSIILVPADDRSYESFKGNFAGTIVPYEGSLRNAVEKVLRDKKVPVLYPVKNGSKTRFFELETTEVCAEGKIISHESLSKALGIDNTFYCLTALSHLFKHVQQLMKGVRSFLANEFIVTFDSLEIGNVLVCSECKKNAQELNMSDLHRCIKCNRAFYCSSDCQRKHWPSHKNRCGLGNPNPGHLAYLKDLNLVEIAPDFFELHYVGKIRKHLASIRKIYTQDKERALIDSYEQSLLVLINYFYSPDEKYAKIRRFFEVGAGDGFGKFCHYVQKKAIEAGSLPA